MQLENNTLKLIPDTDGYYLTREGKVYTTKGKGRKANSDKVSLYEIYGRPTQKGYLRIYPRLVSTGKRKDMYIHRLVAELFIDNQNGYNIVNHKNCNRQDNRVENLEWCSVKHNAMQTLELNHLTRNEDGTFKSNFNWRE